MLSLLLAMLLFVERPGLENAPAIRAQAVDLNEDGWLDLVLGGSVYWNREGRFEAGGEVLAGKVSFALWGDLNGDGHLDAVAVTQKAGSRVFLGDGKGRFQALGPCGLEAPHNTLSGALGDLDRDGRLDVVLANAYVDESKGYQAEPMQVLQGVGDGTFRTVDWGFAQDGPPGSADGARPLYGVSLADLNNDGFPEILGAAYGRQWNTLWMRNTAGRYSECAAKFGLDGDSVRHGRYSQATREKFRKRGQERQDELPYRSNGNTFCLAPADFDNDGDLDVFSSDITHAWAGDSSDLSSLLVNRLEGFGEPFFERWLEVLAEPDPETGFRTRPTGGLARDHTPQAVETWNQGDLQAHWGDLDLDGRLDLLVCESDYPHNRLRIFLQSEPGRFHEAERELGVEWPNCPGLTLGDFDRDGDLDMVTLGTRTRWPEARERDRLAYWENRASGNFLGVKGGLYGARIYLTTDQGQQMRELAGPGGHWAQQSAPGEAHFGLGSARPLRLRLVWPTGAETVLTDLPARGYVTVHR